MARRSVRSTHPHLLSSAQSPPVPDGGWALALGRSLCEDRRVAGASAPRLPRALTGRHTDRDRPEEWFLGSLQAQILQVLAKRGPSTVREILEALPRSDARAYTTVMTILVKLHRKRIVDRRRVGKGYVYTARYAPDQLRDRMAEYLVDELVDDFGDAALAHFASALDRLDRARLRKLLRR